MDGRPIGESYSMTKLKGRIALVTGASRGIGAASARALAAMGATVIVSDIARSDDLAAEIGGAAIVHDVTREQDWADAMSFAQDNFGGLDILVNNAGLFLMKSLADTTLDDWRRIHTVNVEGVFLGCRYAAPLLAARAKLWAAGGSIINLSSVAGLIGSPNTSCYNASKGAVRLFTKGVAIELASQGIRVNSVHPGVIDTVMGSELVAGFSDRLGVVESDARVAVGGLHPLGRFGRDADVAAAVAFLASDDAAFMTGSEMVVDGGMTAQ